MTYVVDTENAAKPADNDQAKVAAAELRALKAKAITMKSTADALAVTVAEQAAAITTAQSTASDAQSTATAAANAASDAQDTADEATAAIASVNTQPVRVHYIAAAIEDFIVPAGVTVLYVELTAGSHTTGSAMASSFGGSNWSFHAERHAHVTRTVRLSVAEGDLITAECGAGQSLYFDGANNRLRDEIPAGATRLKRNGTLVAELAPTPFRWAFSIGGTVFANPADAEFQQSVRYDNSCGNLTGIANLIETNTLTNGSIGSVVIHY
jgi:hypothetical protein